jgi:primosomal protein N' (replication factor Y) (superfamily II helicase)
LSQPALSQRTRVRRGPRAVRVSLLIPTHALPSLSYRVPKRLRAEVRVGTAVVAPLSGHLRFGVVVAAETKYENARESLRDVAGNLSLPPELIEVCSRIARSAAVPLPVVLRAALPPGLNTSRYRVLEPAPEWPWGRGELVTRAALKRELGAERLREAEAEGRVSLSPAVPEPAQLEWAVIRAAASPDLSRAPRQRCLLDTLRKHGGAHPASALLSESGAARSTLRELARRGAVRLVWRPQPAPVFAGRGDSGDLEPFLRIARSAARRGGAFVWRIPTAEQPEAVAALARTTVEDGEQALVLVPEIELAERLVRRLRRELPEGLSVAAYHSGLARYRTPVYEAASAGKVDVLVGARTAALLPFARLGTICVVDEPNEAHRAEPGYEGLPIHVRDVALERGRIEGCGVFCLSPFPTLGLFAPEARERAGIRALPARLPARWPSVRLVDMRGSGAALSSTALDACGRIVTEGGRVGVVANRLGYAAAVTCNGCGRVRSCPDCALPLALHEREGLLVCNHCGHREKVGCAVCGSERVSPVGLAVERVREEISSRLHARVGLITASERELNDAPVVVGTSHCILEHDWDAVVLPDVDSSLLGTGITAVERAFRLVYRAAEAARRLLLVQTRQPEHYALREAVRGDYPAFAAAELPRLCSLGYPPFAHLASVTLEGPREIVRRAVEFRLRSALKPGVEMSGPVPMARGAGTLRWKVLLRSPDRSTVARAATLAARLPAEVRGLKVRVDVDPEEV